MSQMSAEQWFRLQLPHEIEPSTARYVPISDRHEMESQFRSYTHESEGNSTPCHSEGKEPALLGRNWLNAIHLACERIYIMNSDKWQYSLSALLELQSEVFYPGLAV